MSEYNMSLYACATSKNILFENLGIERISPYLKNNGYSVEYNYLFYDMPTSELEQLLTCDIAAFSLYPDTYDFACKCIQHVKKNGGYTIVGGKYATDNHQELLQNIPDIDAICLGHGEVPYLTLLNMLSGGRSFKQCINEIPFFTTRKKLPQAIKICVSNINDLCNPDRTKYLSLSKPGEVFICDSHGCTGRCTFCSNCQNMHQYSTRNPASIVAEIEELNNSYGITQFNLTGNSFEDPGCKGKEKINEFCDLILQKRMKIALGCYIKGDFIKSEQDKILLDKMVNAGFTHIFIGVEAANEADLTLYGKRATQNDTDQVLTYLRKHFKKTLTSCGFIMINPFTTTDRLKSNYYFLANNSCFVLANYISRLFIYPETAMYHLCNKEGVLLSNFDSLHPLSYKIIDDDVKKVYQYITETLIPFQNRQPNILDSVRNIYGIRSISNPNSNLDDLLFQILEEASLLLKEYFYFLFVELDIAKCQEMFHHWSEEMDRIHKRLDILFTKYKFEYVRNYNYMIKNK